MRYYFGLLGIEKDVICLLILKLETCSEDSRAILCFSQVEGYLPGMDSCAFCVCSDLKQVRNHEIRLCRWWRSHQERLVHLLWMLSVLISFRVYTDGFYAESVSSLGDTTGDLTSICN